ncbi:MAG: hypothetical protein ACLTBS_00870 [Eisenbergiella sp.]
MAESIKILFWKDAKFAVHPFFSLEKRLTPAGNLFRIKMIRQEGELMSVLNVMEYLAI